MGNDGNAEFLQEFYSCLSYICEDLFFSRFKQSSAFDAAVASGVSPAEAGRTLLGSIFSGAHNDAERSNGVAELLDVKIAPAVGSDGSAFPMTGSALSERMEQYSGVQVENDVEELMTKMEEESQSASEKSEGLPAQKTTSYVDDRLEELLKPGERRPGLSRKITPRVAPQGYGSRRMFTSPSSQALPSPRQSTGSLQRKDSSGDMTRALLQVCDFYSLLLQSGFNFLFGEYMAFK